MDLLNLLLRLLDEIGCVFAIVPRDQYEIFDLQVTCRGHFDPRAKPYPKFLFYAKKTCIRHVISKRGCKDAICAYGK